jgi:hypothetical protein
MIPPEIEPVIEELLVVLDDETELLELKRAQLADLSKILLRNDNEAAEALLKQIEEAQTAQVLLELRLQTLREILAGTFGCSSKEFNLSRLIDELPQEQADAVRHRRRQVACKVDEFRRQHLQTAILLAECSRITGMMLDSLLLPAGGAVVTYDTGGSDHWRAGTSLLDMER